MDGSNGTVVPARNASTVYGLLLKFRERSRYRN